MDIDDDINEIIAKDYTRGQIIRLKQWDLKHGDSLKRIEATLNIKVLSNSIGGNLRVFKYILNNDNIPDHNTQIRDLKLRGSNIEMNLARGSLQNNVDCKLAVVQHLQALLYV